MHTHIYIYIYIHTYIHVQYIYGADMCWQVLRQGDLHRDTGTWAGLPRCWVETPGDLLGPWNNGESWRKWWPKLGWFVRGVLEDFAGILVDFAGFLVDLGEFLDDFGWSLDDYVKIDWKWWSTNDDCVVPNLLSGGEWRERFGATESFPNHMIAVFWKSSIKWGSRWGYQRIYIYIYIYKYVYI